MKKFFALLMALVMVFSMSTVAFAADATETDGLVDSRLTDETFKETADVTVTVVDTNVSRVYYVVLEWDSDMTFTYTFDTATWNPTDHSYSTTTGSWEGDDVTATIKVTNHSNASVDVSMKFDDADSVVMIDNSKTEDVMATLTGNVFSLGNAEGTNLNAAPNDSATVTISGTPELRTASTVSKTITVTITAG